MKQEATQVLWLVCHSGWKAPDSGNLEVIAQSNFEKRQSKT